jgi:alkaline phosphatase D
MTTPRLLLVALALLTSAAAAQTTFDFDSTPDRVWIGRDFWANRLQDWRITDSRVECVETRKNMPMRTAQVLTHALGVSGRKAEISVQLGPIDPDAELGPNAAAGLLLGAGGPGIDPRLTAQVHHVPAEDGGMAILVERDGSVSIRRNDQRPTKTPLWAISMPIGPDQLPLLGQGMAAPDAASADQYTLVVQVVRGDSLARVTARTQNQAGDVLHFAFAEIDHDLADGCIALLATGGPEGSPSGFWFDDLALTGDLVKNHPDRAFGPVWHTMYTRGDHGIAMTAQLPPLVPLGTPADQINLPEVELWADDNGWRKVASEPLTPDSWTATFREPEWDTSRDIRYEVRFAEPTTTDEPLDAAYPGTFRATPDVTSRDYVIATFTGHKTYTGGLKWNRNGLWFPASDMVTHVAAHNPDFLFFSGDQIYEGDLTPVDARNLDILTLDYLYKWTKWCWDFGELTRNLPAVAIPDDHDVYHGNVWGAGGRHAKRQPGVTAQDAGGYKHPPAFVNIVHRTQTSNLPRTHIDPVIGDGYTTYSTVINDAGVSFAVLADRMFKESPTIAVPEAKYVNGWPQAEGFDERTNNDDPTIPLLGEQQERMLRDWATDWSNNAWMKVVLSQTPLAGPHTIPATARSDGVVPGLTRLAPGDYPPDDMPSQDADTNGWPRPGRDRGVEALRRGFAIHLNGDQHLATLLRYGLDDWGDAGVSFAAPSVANTWPRRWFPIEEPVRRDEGAPRYTGDYLDGFGNKITMIAAANPIQSGQEPAGLYDKAPGYGIVRLNRADRTITYECWPRWVDPTAADAACYEGWPVTMHQADNCGSSWQWAVGAVVAQDIDQYVVTVTREGESEPLYSIRVYDGFIPRVPDEGPWDQTYTNTAAGHSESRTGILASDDLDAHVCREATN